MFYTHTYIFLYNSATRQSTTNINQPSFLSLTTIYYPALDAPQLLFGLNDVESTRFEAY